MPTGTLHIDLEAIAANWRALDAMSAPSCETAAVVKADAYGLGLTAVAPRLAREGARAFFVATVEEGLALRRTLGPEPRIYCFYGHMAGDTTDIQRADLVPMLCSVDQLTRHLEALPRHPFGLQLDSGMNRLGLKEAEWAAVSDIALEAGPVLLTSHLASSDNPSSEQNAAQLAVFRRMTDGIDVPRSLAATGGTLLGPAYHFDMVRPGIGLYGGLPYAKAEPVVALELPVIACFDVARGEGVGYGASWIAPADARIATVAGGYADGLHRALQPGLDVMAGKVPCPVVGRVSMDLLTVDISHLDSDPEHVSVLSPHHGVDMLAEQAGTIGYEMLTSLGRRYQTKYRGL
ncbi:alanine racemase [Jannaschia seohaensis]|uniref:Alanine racemase n=1 Tax=Jannaschia seohaensis TaxID=475081 RepID=A0A2Y9AMT7_9RHOB|nr:alanine racemase [Jannaschia seohaensis]PWJ19182.1 alanine racemase [Jannaschia seohaensis]SSA45844.1 alanine racemase [Jannaschia seohaensis]